MTSESRSPERFTQAIFSVCADETTVRIATAAALKIPGAQFAGEFRDYLNADKRPQFSPLLHSAASCVALINFDRDPEMALETAERLRKTFHQKISIIGIGAKIDAGVLLRAIRNGCAEFLTTPISEEEFAAALSRFADGVVLDTHSKSGAGRVIALCGAKGGVGTTMLAVHLATHLVSQHGKKTLLVDLKQQLGHVALFLGLRETQYHFEELLRNAGRLDSGLLQGLAVRHRSGLEIIGSPETASGVDESKSGQFAQVIDFLRGEYDCVLLDCATALHDAHSLAVDQADEIYIVATPDVAALRDLSRLVERLSLSEATASKLRIVVNRSTSTDAVGAEQIENAVRFPISVSVPNNYFELLRAINDGEPIPPQRRSEFNQALAHWADLATGSSSTLSKAPVKRGLFSFLR